MKSIKQLNAIFTIGLGDIAEIMVDATSLKGSGKLITIPFSFDVSLSFLDQEADLFINKMPESIKQAFELNRVGYIEEVEDYVTVSVRLEESLYLYAKDNYISVWGSKPPKIETEYSFERGLLDYSNNRLGYHYGSHDSGWRESVSRFQKTCFKALESHFEAMEAEFAIIGIKPRYNVFYHSSMLNQRASIKENCVELTMNGAYRVTETN